MRAPRGARKQKYLSMDYAPPPGVQDEVPWTVFMDWTTHPMRSMAVRTAWRASAVSGREGDAELVPVGRLISQFPAGLGDDEVVLPAAVMFIRAAVRGGGERMRRIRSRSV